MGEKNLDFDTVINRRGTYSIKYDTAQKNHMPEDILPLWVADMDFKVSSYIQEALLGQIEHGIFGYSEMQDEYFAAVQSWMRRHHNWQTEQEWLVKTPGIVFALAMSVRAFTQEGEAVLIQPPVYHPFRRVIETNNRKLVCSPLVLGMDGRYQIDFEDFEKKIIEEKVRLFLLCSPHNPVGRVWTEKELERLGDICCKHHVIVVSDEIHSDFVFQGKHRVFADIKEEFLGMSVTATAPSKTFNIAGLQASNIFIPNPQLREKFERELLASGSGELTIMGMLAAKAAYEHGDEWYEAMHRYVKENIAFAKDFIEKRIPAIKMMEQEGTYLLWLDCRALPLTDSQRKEFMVQKALLWLDEGSMFGSEGAGFERVNAACPRAVLKEALERLAQAVHGLEDGQK